MNPRRDSGALQLDAALDRWGDPDGTQSKSRTPHSQWLAIVLGSLLAWSSPLNAAPALDRFLDSYCLDCHDADTHKGDVVLESPTFDRDSLVKWTRVYDAVEAGDMPPKKKRQPTAEERKAVLVWLREMLTKHDRPGGTVLRRLNRREYENSVRAALGIPFTVPHGFPADTRFHGFDNNGEGLVLSPPLMQKYFELAGLAADMLIPPAKTAKRVPADTVTITPEEMSMAFEAVQLRDGVMRLVTKSGVLVRSCSWPTRFEATHTGTYSIRTRLSSFKADSGAELEVELIVIKPSMTFTKLPGLRRVAEFNVPADGKVHEFEAEFDLEQGETVAYYWRNAPMGHADISKDGDVTDRIIHELFVKSPKMHAAWARMGGFDRTRSAKSTWAELKRLAANPNLEPVADEPRKRYSALIRNQLGWALQNMRMEQGPALDIHGASFHGPTKLKPSRDDAAQQRRTEKFLGRRDGRSDREFAAGILQPFLEQAFRRPVNQETLAQYVNVAVRHRAAGHRFEDGIHLAVRTALCSAHFIYRGQRDGRLDDHDLATRLSYFLTESPPDAKLMKLAANGTLSDTETLTRETRRLLDSRQSRAFIRSFAGQWLHLDRLPDIMPDERLIRWTSRELSAVTQETELFISHILEKNMPLEAFIDPGFTYLNKRNAKLYGRKVTSDDLQMVTLEKGGRFGGILGQASVMMATANGVDTQPVLRGVWLLENIFGNPPPEPPTSVPAIEPDTSGAKSIRELLKRHQADPSCAGCHRKIDPLGFALENFDPVGRWRDHYPLYEKKGDKVVSKKGLPVEAATTLADGTPIRDVTDLKRYLVKNIDQFSRCLTGKLLTYATGRTPTFGDREQINQIVARVKSTGNGFQDLIVELVQSDSFRTK